MQYLPIYLHDMYRYDYLYVWGGATAGMMHILEREDAFGMIPNFSSMAIKFNLMNDYVIRLKSIKKSEIYNVTVCIKI